MSTEAKTPEPKVAEPMLAPGGRSSYRWLIVTAALFAVVAIAGAWAYHEFSEPPQIKATPRSHSLMDLLSAARLPEVTLAKRSDRSGHLYGKAHNQSGEMLHKVKLWIKNLSRNSGCVLAA